MPLVEIALHLVKVASRRAFLAAGLLPRDFHLMVWNPLCLWNPTLATCNDVPVPYAHIGVLRLVQCRTD